MNLGNMHLLAFHLRGPRIASLYEHHTGEVTAEQIVWFTQELAAGSLENEAIFTSQGQGALHRDRSIVGTRLPEMIAATGPQRSKIRDSVLRPYFAAPFGDMMIGGCFGLLRAYAELYPDSREAIERRLGPLPDAR